MVGCKHNNIINMFRNRIFCKLKNIIYRNSNNNPNEVNMGYLKFKWSHILALKSSNSNVIHLIQKCAILISSTLLIIPAVSSQFSFDF